MIPARSAASHKPVEVSVKRLHHSPRRIRTWQKQGKKDLLLPQLTDYMWLLTGVMIRRNIKPSSTLST